MCCSGSRAPQEKIARAFLRTMSSESCCLPTSDSGQDLHSRFRPDASTRADASRRAAGQRSLLILLSPFCCLFAVCRQTHSLKLGQDPQTPPTFFQAGSASASPTSQRLTGITDWLIMGVEIVLRLTRRVQATRGASREMWGVLVFGCVSPRVL